MRNILLALILLSITSCSFQADNATPLKAVYFVHGQGELSAEDLQAHPEVAVVQTFDEFKQYASRQKIALWIDKSAAPFNADEEESWINAAPQAYYPLVLVGYSDMVLVSNSLRLDCFLGGPTGPYPGMNAPGFSVILRKPPADPTTACVDTPFIHGYNQKLTVQAILEITNDLLIGKIRPTPISTLPKAFIEIPTSAARSVILYDEEPKNGFPNDAAKIAELYLPIRDNILTMNIIYQGHCKEHTFELHVWTAFLQSSPPQAVVYLSHDAHGDTCTDDVEQELSFDLSPLNKERNDPSEHPLLLRIFEPIGGSFAKDPLPFSIQWP